MKVKIGKYEVEEWLKFKTNDRETYLKVCDDGTTTFGIYIYNDNGKWSLIIHDDLLTTAYKSMFPNDCLEFETLEDGKVKVDLFFNKLQKLKVFL